MRIESLSVCGVFGGECRHVDRLVVLLMLKENRQVTGLYGTELYRCVHD